MTSEETEAIRRGSGLWDHDSDPAQHTSLTEWLERQAADPWMRQVWHRTLSFLGASSGMRVLEVGCGTGVFLPVLAHAVSPGGHVVGIDHSEALLDEARQRMLETESVDLVTIQLADAYHLPFAAGSFDAAHTEHVLEHLDNPDAVLREMARVVKPGGRIVVGEPYLLGSEFDHPDPEGLHLVLSHGFRRFRCPRSGLELNRRMAQVGLVERDVELFTRLVTELDPQNANVFTEIAAEAVAEGIVTRERAEALVDYLEEASRGRYFTSYYPFFLVSGRVPFA